MYLCARSQWNQKNDDDDDDDDNEDGDEQTNNRAKEIHEPNLLEKHTHRVYNNSRYFSFTPIHFFSPPLSLAIVLRFRCHCRAAAAAIFYTLVCKCVHDLAHIFG